MNTKTTNPLFRTSTMSPSGGLRCVYSGRRLSPWRLLERTQNDRTKNDRSKTKQ